MQKFQINIGKTLPAFRGEWDKDTEYNFNDVVTRYYSSYVYIAKTPSSNKDPYKQETYTDENNNEKLYWGLLAGRGAKGAKWYVGNGTVNPQERASEEDVQLYTITGIDESSGQQVGDIALVGDYYLQTETGTIYICVYPGGSDEEGNIGNEAALWEYSTEFNWLETYRYFFINTKDIETIQGNGVVNTHTAIKKYYRYTNNQQTGDELEVVNLGDQAGEETINIDSSRFNCYLYADSGATTGETIPPMNPISIQGNISWNKVVDVELEEDEIKIDTTFGQNYQNIWILVEQFSISQTTSSFTFNNMMVNANSVDWTQDASVSTSYEIVETIKHPVMTFNIPRGRPFTIKKIYDTLPSTDETIFAKYDIVLGRVTDQTTQIASYHFFYNDGEGVGYTPVWINMGIFNYTIQLRYDNVALNGTWKTYISSDFPYIYDLQLDNLQENMIPYVVLDNSTAINQKISPTASILKDDNQNVVLRLYAASVPPSNTVLSTVVCTLPPYVEGE